MASKIQVLWLIKLVSNLMSHPKPSRYLGSGNQYFLCVCLFSPGDFSYIIVCVCEFRHVFKKIFVTFYL